MKLPDNKWLLAFLFIGAVLVKMALLRAFLYIDSDRSLQLVAAAEWAKGFGYTVPQVDLQAVNMVHHRVLLEWPPLYSAMLVPLLKLTNFNLIRSSFWMDSLGALLYLLAIWRLAIYLGFTPLLQMLIVWFKATEIYEGILLSFPTDFLAAACWIWAIYFLLQYLDSPEKKWIGGLVLAMSASFLFRYVYLVALPVLPVLLWWNGYKQKRPEWKQAAFLLAISLMVIVGAYLSFNKIQTGSFTYLEQWDKGFYPEKLLNIVPLLWQSIGHVTFIGVQLELGLHVPYRTYQVFLQLTSFIVLTIMLIRWLAGKQVLKLDARKYRYSAFLVAAAWLSLAIIGTLTILSLRIDFPKDSRGGTWSYLVEDRYFLVPLTVILFVVSWQLFMTSWQSGRLQQVLRWLYFAAFTVQVLHAGWVLNKRLPTMDANNMVDPSGKRDSLKGLFQEGRARGEDVVLLSKEYGYIYYALENKVKVCRQVNALTDSTRIGVDQPTTIVASVSEMDYRKYRAFFDKYHFDLRQRFLEEVHLIAQFQPGKP